MMLLVVLADSPTSWRKTFQRISWSIALYPALRSLEPNLRIAHEDLEHKLECARQRSHFDGRQQVTPLELANSVATVPIGVEPRDIGHLDAQPQVGRDSRAPGLPEAVSHEHATMICSSSCA